MSSAQQSTPVEGLIVVHITPEGLVIGVDANSSNSSDTAQPAAEAMEVPHGTIIAHHVAVTIRRKDASTSPTDQTGVAASVQQVGHTQATGDIFYGRT